MSSTHTTSIESIRGNADILHAAILKSAAVMEVQSNRHHVVNARLAANRAKKTMAAALMEFENAVRCLSSGVKDMS